MATLLALPVLTALSVAQAAAQPPCEGWTTQQFWRTAGPATVRECLAAGYRINDQRLPRNITALHWAAGFSHDPEVITVLLEAGASLEASSPPEYRTPLHYAARYSGHPEVVRTLLQYGADVYAVNRPGRTPLHLAALFNDNPEVVEELVKATRVNTQARDGETPLHDAARRRPNDMPRVGDPSPAIVEVLLRNGADLSAEALDGGTPVRWAEDGGVANLIQSEEERRAAIRERFLRSVVTRVVAGALVLTLLASLAGVAARRSRKILGRLSGGRPARSG
ncbi:ankyrin repeat domain-containing protein [Candidatus Palauibacter sp.]|uniref:ankyrin repeat domain-containing protein n=1 Tax=Candidatus Palauibacter sp. TaxID=3101350 RepID=UPI003B02645D